MWPSFSVVSSQIAWLIGCYGSGINELVLFHFNSVACCFGCIQGQPGRECQYAHKTTNHSRVQQKKKNTDIATKTRIFQEMIHLKFHIATKTRIFQEMIHLMFIPNMPICKHVWHSTCWPKHQFMGYSSFNFRVEMYSYTMYKKNITETLTNASSLFLLLFLLYSSIMHKWIFLVLGAEEYDTIVYISKSGWTQFSSINLQLDQFKPIIEALKQFPNTAFPR
jgi:hypothetical protein